MSRTNHHRQQKQNKLGLDFGSRYKHNIKYGGGYGKTAKLASHIELRQRDKQEVCKGIQEYIK